MQADSRRQLAALAMFCTEKQKTVDEVVAEKMETGLTQCEQLVTLPGQLALIGCCGSLLSIQSLFPSHYRISSDWRDSDPVGNRQICNINIMSVNRSHYGIMWADNWFRASSNREHPEIIGKGESDPKSAHLPPEANIRVKISGPTLIKYLLRSDITDHVKQRVIFCG